MRAYVKAVISVLSVAVLFVILQFTGLLNKLVPSQLADSNMGYITLFVTGLLTSVHCIAMCGGINLSQSIAHNQSFKSSLMYNIGRVISYTVIGLLLGTVGFIIGGGTSVGIPVLLQSFLKILAGAFMVLMGADMLGLFADFKFRLPMPRFMYSASAKAKTPFIVGLLNGLMPCGPLQAMWLVALATGSPVKGAFSMLLFSLGTVPLMLGLGAFIAALGLKFARAVQSVGAVLVTVMGISMLSQGQSLSGMFSQSSLYVILVCIGVAAIILAVPFGKKILSYSVCIASVVAVIAAGIILNKNTGSIPSENIASIENGIQVVTSKLEAGLYPTITVQKDVPARWTIRAEKGSINGCNSSMLLSDFGLEYTFHEGDNLIEFTPESTGKYTYTCWMGMIKGNIIVVDNIKEEI